MYKNGLHMIISEFSLRIFCIILSHNFHFPKVTNEPVVNLGDLGKYITIPNENGEKTQLLTLNGRADAVVKVRGFRVDLYGVETVLVSLDEVIDCACLLFNEQIVCFIESPPDRETNAVLISQLAKEKLPEAHVPSEFYFIDSLPRTATGKRDRVALKTLLESKPKVDASRRLVVGEVMDEGENEGDLLPDFVEKMDEFSQKVYKVFTELLNQDLSNISWNESFFEIGGHSLLAIKLAAKLQIKITDIFVHSSMAALSALLRANSGCAPVVEDSSQPLPKYLQANASSNENDEPIYVLGMAGRFPGADNITEFWDMLLQGKDGIVDVQPPRHGWVTRAGPITDELVKGFDLDFWGMGKTEAIQTDPQQRVMLEICYEALDDAGLLCFSGDKQQIPLDVGCFLACGSLPHYLTDVLVNDLGKLREQQPSEYWKIECGNDKDYMPTRVGGFFMKIKNLKIIVIWRKLSENFKIFGKKICKNGFEKSKTS